MCNYSYMTTTKICLKSDCDRELMDPSPVGEAGDDSYYCEGCGSAWNIEAVEKPRYTVNAIHKPSNGFDGPTTVDYWRVFDNHSGMRANGTAKYQDRAQAQAWCDHLNRTA